MTPATTPWRSLASLIPNTISVYLSKQAYEAPSPMGTGTAAPMDNTKPFKPWRDNASLYPGSWFGQAAGPAVYKTLATDEQGQLLLTPVGSPEFLGTYSASDAVVRTYREYSHLFPKGVPYLVAMTMDRAVAAQFNYGSDGRFTPPPAQIASNLMLAQGDDAQWYVIDYQAWIGIQRSKAPASDVEKVKRAVEIGLDPSKPFSARASEMRTVLNTGLPTVGPVV